MKDGSGKVRGRGVGRACVMLGGVAAVLAIRTVLAQQQPVPEGDRKVFNNSVIPLPAEPGTTPTGLVVNLAKAEHKADKVDLLFSLPISAEGQAKLEEKVAKGEVVKPEELNQEFAAKQSDVDALVKWLKSEKFEVEKITPDRTSVYARASGDQVEKSLKVQFVRVTRDGITYTAARNAPSLPIGPGNAVQAIIGLQPFRHARKQSRMMTPSKGNRAGSGEADGSRAESIHPSPAIANAAPYLISEVLKAYNADGLGVTGAGQKVAILIDTFPSDSDLDQFWKRNHLSVTTKNVEKVQVKPGPLPHLEGEETLDVEWATGIAPGATIRVYASGSLAFVDLDRALDAILADLPTQPEMRQVSISLGLGETFLISPGSPPLSGEVAVQHQKFLRMAAAGVNVFVSSGDAGSNPDNTGHNPTGPLQAEFEASDPFVIGVGGTTLELDASTGNVSDETAWPGSGGGESLIFPRPAYQLGPGFPVGSHRLVPDVSLAADPNRGAFILIHGRVQQIGGTSWSAPTWAGICALMNEARAKAHKPSLPFLNPVIYKLIGTSSFRDITSGSNGSFGAGPGYDRVTGIGVPDVKALIRQLTQ